MARARGQLGGRCHLRRERWTRRRVRNCFGRCRRDEQSAALHSRIWPRGNDCFDIIDGRRRLSCGQERGGSVRSRNLARARRSGGKSGGRNRRDGALLSIARLHPRRIAENGGAPRATARTIRTGDGAKRAGLVRASFPESVDCRVLGWDFHRDWRFRSNYSILFLGRNYGGNSFLQHQFSGALSCRRIEIVDHDPFLVGFGSGNDVDRHYCRRRYLRPRSRLWRTGVKESYVVTRILLAHDERDVLAALRILLKGEGYQWEAVRSVAEVCHE